MAYKLLSAYGTRASYAIGWFVLAALAASLLLVAGSFTLPSGSVARFGGDGDFLGLDVLLFSLQSMVAFFRPPATDLSTAEAYTQLALRFIGPVLIAQAILAIRERVAR